MMVRMNDWWPALNWLAPSALIGAADSGFGGGGGGFRARSIFASFFSAWSSLLGTSTAVATNPATVDAPSVSHGYCRVRLPTLAPLPSAAPISESVREMAALASAACWARKADSSDVGAGSPGSGVRLAFSPESFLLDGALVDVVAVYAPLFSCSVFILLDRALARRPRDRLEPEDDARRRPAHQ